MNYRKNGELYFSFKGNYCELTKKMTVYLEKKYSGNNEQKIEKNIIRLLEKNYNSEEEWILKIINERKNCIESPLYLLLEVINDKKNENVCEIGLLACDACVNVKPFEIYKNLKKTKKISDILKEINDIDNSREIYLQKFGKCLLNEKEIKEFKVLMNHLTNSDIDLIKKLRLSVPYYNNYINYNKYYLHPEILELATKQIISLEIANTEIYIIEKYINDNNLSIESVKGNRIRKYYPNNNYRVHMDFDYVSRDFEDAFILIDFLINKRNFKFVINGSVPFSLKNVLDNKNNETLIGHIHLEKVLQDQYQVIVDINIGGFPLGRTGVIKFEKIELEDLICITIAHIFKHEKVYMKDLNDLYYLLNSSSLNVIKLKEKLKIYQLNNLFYTACIFLKKMGCKKIFHTKYNIFINKFLIKNWPYSRKSHFFIKIIDMMIFNINKFKFKRGIYETKNQILNSSSCIKSIKYRNLCENLNERIYLHPLIIFNEFITLKNIELNFIEDNIYTYNNLLILPIGIFFMGNNKNSEKTNRDIEKDIDYILNLINIDYDKCNYNYLSNARKELWLY